MSELRKKRALRWAGALAIALIAFLIGRTTSAPAPTEQPEATATEPGPEETVWTCSMHPQIRRDEPGQCPICGMDLIPLESQQDESSDSRVTLSARARDLARVRTSEVGSASSPSQLHLLGHVDYDETRRRTVTAWTDGRIDQLKIRVTGARIGRNQVIAKLYSPEIYSAFGDLVAASKQAARLADGLHGTGQLASSALEAARARLRLLGVPAAEITRVEQAGVAPEHVSMRSPFRGTVLQRLVEEGQYVKAGTPLFQLADLNRLWVQIDAYESDLAHLEVGQTVTVEVRSLPGEPFEGRIAFIDPVLDHGKRTARVRVEVANAEGKLRPGMFAQARIDADAVQAQAQLVIPDTAPLFTGRRSVVYVEVPGAVEPTYEMREVELAARRGPVYPVLSGLSPGERVVTHGAFAIDAELQLRGGASMMAADGDAHAARAHGATAANAESMRAIVEGYLAMQQALADDDLARTRAAAAALAQAAAATNEQLAMAAHGSAQAADLDGARGPLERMGRAVLALVRAHGNPLDRPLREAHCPMAQNSLGGTWLQLDGELRNPFYGAAMLTCGEFVGDGFAGTGAGTEGAPRPKVKARAKEKTKPKVKARAKEKTQPKAEPTSQPADPHAGHHHDH
ncbi:MAG: efflux RND transporter periplasmic adaptor subunit [Myxococcales bacterium]|nr:efflux RND transporter periplasmic adaptor subunit [Myxococcales bacterium]